MPYVSTKLMKRFLPVFLILTILSLLPASAAGTVSIETGSVTCRNNRLIEVEVKAQGSGKLSAALFEFTFDKSVLEYRKIHTPDGSDAVCVEKDYGIRLSYLCTNGVTLSTQPTLFTIEFKTVAEGESEVGFRVMDCVDSDAQWMDIGSCLAGTVTVSNHADDTVGTAEPKQQQKAASTSESESKQGGSKKSSAKSSAKAKDRQETTAAPVHDLGTLNNVVEREADKTTPIIVLCASVAVAAAVIGWIIFQIKHKKENNSSEN